MRASARARGGGGGGAARGRDAREQLLAGSLGAQARRPPPRFGWSVGHHRPLAVAGMGRAWAPPAGRRLAPRFGCARRPGRGGRHGRVSRAGACGRRGLACSEDGAPLLGDASGTLAPQQNKGPLTPRLGPKERLDRVSCFALPSSCKFMPRLFRSPQGKLTLSPVAPPVS